MTVMRMSLMIVRIFVVCILYRNLLARNMTTIFLNISYLLFGGCPYTPPNCPYYAFCSLSSVLYRLVVWFRLRYFDPMLKKMSAPEARTPLDVTGVLRIWRAFGVHALSLAHLTGSRKRRHAAMNVARHVPTLTVILTVISSSCRTTSRSRVRQASDY